MKATVTPQGTTPTREWGSYESSHHLKRQLFSFNLTQSRHNLFIAKLIKVHCEWKSKQTCGAAWGAFSSLSTNTSGLSDVSKVAGGRGEEKRGGASFVNENKWLLFNAAIWSHTYLKKQSLFNYKSLHLVKVSEQRKPLVIHLSPSEPRRSRTNTTRLLHVHISNSQIFSKPSKKILTLL